MLGAGKVTGCVLCQVCALCPWLCRCWKLQRREVLRCAEIPLLGRTGCGRLWNGLGWCCPSDKLHGTAAKAGVLRLVRMRSSEIWGKQKLSGRFCTSGVAVRANLSLFLDVLNSRHSRIALRVLTQANTHSGMAVHCFCEAENTYRKVRINTFFCCLYCFLFKKYLVALLCNTVLFTQNSNNSFTYFLIFG